MIYNDKVHMKVSQNSPISTVDTPYLEAQDISNPCYLEARDISNWISSMLLSYLL